MRDAGLQPERTELAWSRTGMLAMLVALLSGRIGMSSASVLHLGAALLLCLLSGLLLHLGHERSRPRHDGPEDEVGYRRGVMLLASLGVVIAAAL